MLHNLFMKHKLQKKYEDESFNARLQMEKNAQKEIAARLKALEYIADNQVRRTRGK